MEKKEKKIALFIDCENIASKWAEKIFESLLDIGDVCIKKAYGDWRETSLKPWDKMLNVYAIEPVHIITGNHNKKTIRGGKNSCDIKLSIDVMNCLYDGLVDCIAIASSDSDFAPLAQEIRKRGVQAIGFGEMKSRQEYQKAFTSFEFLFDSTLEIEKSLKQNKALIRMLKKAIDETSDGSGKSSLGSIGSWIRNNYSQSAKSYGKNTWGEIFKVLKDEFEITRQKGVMLVEYLRW